MKLDKEIFVLKNGSHFFMGIVEDSRNQSIFFRKYKNSDSALKLVSVVLSIIPGVK